MDSDTHSDTHRMRPTLAVGILGRVRATVGGREVDLGGARQRALLAVLAVRLGRTVPTDVLVDAVWDGDPPDAAGRTFRSYVSRLRKALGQAGVDGTEAIRTDAAGYRLDDAVVELDAVLFERDVEEARDRLAGGESAVAVAALDEALGRWQGRALGEFADRPWATPTAARLEELRLVAEELRTRALLDAARTQDAVVRSEQLAAAEPLRESVVRLHALALYRAGRDADALRVAREFRQRLAEGHGLDASPQLAELESMVLDRDPRLDRAVGGRRLRGYVLHEPIARSPLGTVHRAEQPSIGREVAITVLPPGRADAPEVVRAFEARVQAVAGLSHPHVLPVYDYWREPGGAYVVTRFPAGGTLAQRLRSGPLGADEALRLGAQVAGALAEAHAAGVAHGALAPDAVVVDERGDAFLWAFSLDAATHPGRDVTSLARLVVVAAGGGEHPGTVVGGGGPALRTEVLPAPAADAVRGVLDGDDGTPWTAARLAAVFDAARGAGSTTSAPTPPSVGPNPYRGLTAFRQSDGDVFFGRDALVAQLLGRLSRAGAVAVVGPSGSGKSSAVRAGLLPQLRAAGAYVTTMVPGTRPLAELEVALSRVAAVELHGVGDEVAATPAGLARVVQRALPGVGGELVLVVDQFEELFTLSDPTERDLLLTALLAAVDDPSAPVRLVATVRADFLGRVLDHPCAGPLVRDRAVMVGPLTTDELHAAVTGPAEVAGVAVEPALATAIVADATRAPGSLPMVQFALTEVFAAAEDGTMRLEAYRRIGGIAGVLGQRAEEVFAGLDDAGQQAAHALFQRLVFPNTDGPPTRRRALRAELAHVPDLVLEAFGRARLLRFDHDQETREPTVEVSHEALFRAWPRLVAWIEQDEDDLRVLGHLTVAAAEWDRRGRPDAELYRGARLDVALAFAAPHREELSATERAFLDGAAEQRRQEAERERRSVRRLRLLTSGLAAGLVLSLVAGAAAVVAQRREAATAQAAQADALAFASSATADADLELAALLAAEAYAISPELESQRALLDVLGHSPQLVRLLEAPPDGFCGAQPPGGDVFVHARFDDAGGRVADVRRFDHALLSSVPVSDGARCPIVDRDGRWVVSGDESTGMLRTYDTATGEVLSELAGWRYPGLFGDVVLHPTDDEALVVTGAGDLRRVSLPDLDVLADLTPSQDLGTVLSATYGELGGRVAVLVGTPGTSQGRRVVVTDTDGAGLVVVDRMDGVFEALVAEQAGLVVASTESGVALTAALDSPEVVVPLLLRGSANGPMAVHPDGTRAAFATSEGLEVVDLTTSTPPAEPIGVDTTFGVPSWGPGGELYFVGPAGTATIDVDRVVGIGEVVSGQTPLQFGLWPATDGSGAVQFAAPDVLWVDAAGGEQVVVGPAPLPQSPVAPLPDRGWALLDLDQRVFQRWRGRDLVVEEALPPSVPSGLERIWGLLRVDNGVAVSIAAEFSGQGAERRPVRRHLLAVEVATGRPLGHQVFDLGGAAVPPLQARALGTDRVVVAFEDAHSEVRSMSGEVLHSRADVVGNGEFLGVSDGGGLVAGADVADAVVVLDDELTPVVRLTGFASTASWIGFVDERLLVTRHLDGSTFLWDLSAGALIGRLFASQGFEPFGLAVAGDGVAVLHATSGGIVRMPLAPSSWQEAVCSLVPRPLAQEELDAVVSGRTPLDPCGHGTSARAGQPPLPGTDPSA